MFFFLASCFERSFLIRVEKSIPIILGLRGLLVILESSSHFTRDEWAELDSRRVFFFLASCFERSFLIRVEKSIPIILGLRGLLVILESSSHYTRDEFSYYTQAESWVSLYSRRVAHHIEPSFYLYSR